MRDLGFEGLDRVKLIETYRNHTGLILKAGTIGTVREIKENTVLIQCKHPIEDKETILLVSNALIEPCEKEDLKNVDYQYLVPKIYHKGNIWAIKNGIDENNEDEVYIGLIVDYELKLNENDDIIWIVPIPLDADVNSFRIENELKNKKKYKKQYLEEFASYGL